MGKLRETYIYHQLTGCSMEDYVNNRAFDTKYGCEEALRKATFQLNLASQSMSFPPSIQTIQIIYQH